MNAKEKLEELLEASEDGTITAAQVTEAGLHRSVLQEFVKSGEMYRFGRGLYVRSSAWEDDFYLLPVSYTHLKIPCRLVGEDDVWLCDQSAGDCHALLLPAGQFMGQMVQTAVDP